MSEVLSPNIAKQATITDSTSMSQARAKRLRCLRKLTGHSRKYFSQTYQLSSGTLQNWETGRFGGLTEKGAHLMLSLLKRESIYCSFEWLMYGSGPGPQTVSTETALDDPLQMPKDSSKTLQTEYEAFKTLYGHTLKIVIQDDAMSPEFNIGDWVAGRIVKPEAIEYLVGHDCIIETEHYGQLLRHIKQHKAHQNTYHLIAHNFNTTVEKPCLYDVKIIQAAPVAWIRTPAS